jgi:hypothetical protein
MLLGSLSHVFIVGSNAGLGVVMFKDGRRKTAQNSIEVDAETKESTRKTEGKLDGRNKEGHERKKPK